MSASAARDPKPVDFTGCRPVLPVADLARSPAHYVDVLGFVKDWEWADEGTVTFAYVFRGCFELFLAQRPEPIAPVEIVVGVASTGEVDRLHQEYRDSGALIEEPPAVRPWGTYEMRLRDTDGHLLRVLSHADDEA